MGRYKVEKAGAWVQPVRRGYRVQCCDCGLVHVIDFRLVGNRIQFRADRDDKATNAIRLRRRKGGY